MTLSLVALDEATGAFGSVIASSSPAVAARCVHLRDDAGAVHSQNITDPRLGPQLLSLLATGMAAPVALTTLLDGEEDMEYRQLIAVDPRGRTAVHSGPRALGIVAVDADHGVIAAGNMLATDQVPARMVAAFRSSTGPTEVRLLAALAAGVAEGGEAGPIHSAGLAVVTGHGWRTTDLRVDWSDDPLSDLDDLVARWLPERDAYVQRALTPGSSPSYGVPGDDR